MSKKLKLGLFGFGCVGQGLYEVLNQTKGIKAEVVKIAVKDRKKVRSFPDTSYFTFYKNEILDNPNIDVVVELIDDADAAYDIVKTALKNGKAVVTANKKLIAEHMEELYELQLKYGKPILYEAACCASIPIIRNLEEYYDNDLVNNVEGILNGSTNYILTNILEYGKSYSEALIEAKEKGFAETDPILDVGGFDAKYKLSIIIAHAYGIFVKPENIFNYGIQNLTKASINYAREKGYAIKLIGHCTRIGEQVYGYVAPQFVPGNNPLANVVYEYNGVEVTGVFAEKQLFTGKGAGGYPTGSAVLSDISALTYNYKYEYKKKQQELIPIFSNDCVVKIHLDFDTEENVNFEDFESIDERFLGTESSYVNGTISLKKLITPNWINNPGNSLILLESPVITPENYAQQEKLFSLAV